MLPPIVSLPPTFPFVSLSFLLSFLPSFCSFHFFLSFLASFFPASFLFFPLSLFKFFLSFFLFPSTLSYLLFPFSLFSFILSFFLTLPTCLSSFVLFILFCASLLSFFLSFFTSFIPLSFFRFSLPSFLLIASFFLCSTIRSDFFPSPPFLPFSSLSSFLASFFLSFFLSIAILAVVLLLFSARLLTQSLYNSPMEKWQINK